MTFTVDERLLRKTLSYLPLGGLRYFEQTNSTNDIALAWAASGARDLALVYAEEQTLGRGRSGRQWFTPAGTALAFSLILRPLPGEQQSLSLFTALGALAVCEAVGLLGLQPEIKWPNDVLLNRRKFCGVLVEAIWLGEKVDSVVVGVGINVVAASVPAPELLNFPATCLDAEAQRTIDRLALLRDVFQALLYWRGLIGKDVFLHAWEHRLAFRGETVEVRSEAGEAKLGKIEGLEGDGSLRLRSPQSEIFTVHVGEVHLRPLV